MGYIEERVVAGEIVSKMRMEIAKAKVERYLSQRNKTASL
jgi:hypothetical protein